MQVSSRLAMYLDYISGDEDEDVEENGKYGSDNDAGSDSSSSSSDSPRQSFQECVPGSFSQTPQWPQSYRHSMDIYSNITSPSLSILSPSISRFTSSYLSTSFRRTVSPDVSASLMKPFLPTEKEKLESSASEQLLPGTAKYSAVKVVDAHEMPHGCSVTQGVLNGMNALCGVGILSTPYAVKEGGWIGLSLLFVLAIACCYTGLLLKLCLESQQGIVTYPDIGQAAFGTFGRIFISIILYTELYGCCVEYLILEGDNLASLFPDAYLNYLGMHLQSNVLFTILAAIFVLPTVWLRDFNILAYLSAGGVLASIMVFMCVFWVGTMNNVGFTETGPLLNLSKLPVSIGLYGYCYSGHSVFPNIYASLKRRNKFVNVLLISFLICAAMYGGIAIMGFAMFGNETFSQITLNLPKHFVVSRIAVWTTVINPFTKYLTGFVMAFIGSFLSMLLCLILPATCFLKLFGSKATISQKICCVAIVIIGTICSIAGTVSSVVGMMKSFLGD
eukprot:c13479_g1_i1 orf=390-1898(-)